MKKFTFRRGFLLLTALSVGLFASCSDVEVNEEETEEVEIENVVIPTTDQLEVTSERSAFVFDLEENGFNKALRNRMTNQVLSLNLMPEVVILGNDDVERLTEEDYSKLADIFIHDGAILMTRPTITNWFIMQFALAAQLLEKVDFSNDERFGNELISEMMILLENDLSDLEDEEGIKARAVAKARSMSRTAAQNDDDEIDWDEVEKYLTEPFMEVVGIRNSETKFVELLDGEVEPEMLVVEKTSIDQDGNETVTTDTLDRESVKITYDGYSYGLYADEVARWINLDVAEQKAKSRSQKNTLAAETRSMSDATERVNSELEANRFSHTINGYYNYKAYGANIYRYAPINLDINYAVIHSFDTGYDYYLIEQKITSQNGQYCCPSEKKKWTWIRKNDHLCGPYLKELEVYNSFAYANGETRGIRLPQEHISPRNENGTTSYTDGVSISLNETLGVGNEGLSAELWGGFEVSSSTTVDVKDLTCYWNPDASTGDNSAKWKYVGNRPEGHFYGPWSGRPTHDVVKPLLRTDCFVQQNFVVRVTNPKETENIYMTTQLQRWVDMYEGWTGPWWMTDHYDKKRDIYSLCVDRLPRPLRTQENWTMTFTTPEGVTVANAEKFLKEFFPTYIRTKLSFMSPYTEKEKENDPKIKQYGPAQLFVQSFANELEESADYFRSQKGKEIGVLPGEYIFTFKRQSISDKIQFKLTVPETGEAIISDRIGI